MPWKKQPRNGVLCHRCGIPAEAYATNILTSGQKRTYYRCRNRPRCDWRGQADGDPICRDCGEDLTRDNRRSTDNLILMVCRACRYTHVIQRPPEPPIGNQLLDALRRLYNKGQDKNE